jgi:hypothetical protein
MSPSGTGVSLWNGDLRFRKGRVKSSAGPRDSTQKTSNLAFRRVTSGGKSAGAEDAPRRVRSGKQIWPIRILQDNP